MPTKDSLLDATGVKLGRTATGMEDAIDQVGRTLVEIGAVEEAYVAAMHEREKSVSTFIGENVAIPHGTDEGRKHVLRTSLVVLQFPDGVDWDGNQVTVCVGIAATAGGHIALLSQLAEVLLDSDRAERLRNATTADEVYELLTPPDDEG